MNGPKPTTDTEALEASRAPVDKREPTAASRAVPGVLIAFVAFMLYWGDMYVMDNGGDLMGENGSFPQDLYYPVSSYASLKDMHPKSDNLFDIGKDAFSYYGCAGCHQLSGLGTPGLNPPLAGSEWVLAEGPNRIIRIILHGLRGPIEVKGEQYNSQMTPFGPVITDDQTIAALATFIRQEWGNNASEVSPEKVAEIREAEASRSTQWTAEELMKIPAAD